jgi:hypothetical protein
MCWDTDHFNLLIFFYGYHVKKGTKKGDGLDFLRFYKPQFGIACSWRKTIRRRSIELCRTSPSSLFGAAPRQARHGKGYRISPAHSISQNSCQGSTVIWGEIFRGRCSFEMIIFTIGQIICDNLE